MACTNSFVEESAPWALHKSGESDRLGAVLAALARSLSRIAMMAAPFLPGKAQEAWEALGRKGPVGEERWAALATPEVGGLTVIKPESLFPKAN